MKTPYDAVLDTLVVANERISYLENNMNHLRELSFRMLQRSVEAMLRNPYDVPWTVQGFGMMRAYLDPDRRFRVNVWNRALSVPKVSIVHDHPWHLTSLILVGRLRNVRYDISSGAPNMNCHAIKTGEGGGPIEQMYQLRLIARSDEDYSAGDIYHQKADEIHASFPVGGTVTMNERERVGSGEHARVFWPIEEQWVDAQARMATREEIRMATTQSLETWFSQIK